MMRTIQFEIQVDQPERALNFYSNVFGWMVRKWQGARGFWLVSGNEETQPAIRGKLMERMTPGTPITVPSVDDFVSKVTANGGKVIAPKITVPGVGCLAYCQDTEGNTFGIFQADKS